MIERASEVVLRPETNAEANVEGQRLGFVGMELLLLFNDDTEITIIQKLDSYGTVPYFSLIVQDDRDEVKQSKFRPEGGCELQLCLFAALAIARKFDVSC